MNTKQLVRTLVAISFLLAVLPAQAALAVPAENRPPIDHSPARMRALALSGDDNAQAVAVDGSGNVYVTGVSNITWGSPVRAFSGVTDAYVAKFNSSGALTWNTFLGGGGQDDGYGIAVDGSGNVYVTGHSNSTWGAPVRAFTAGYGEAFAAKLTSSGALTWNTFLGGSGEDVGNDIAVDGGGNVYVAGYSDATWGSPVRAYAGDQDSFAAKLTSAGALTWNTFQGGGTQDNGYGIAVDGSGTVHVTGHSDATWGSPVRAFSGSYDAFAAKLDSAGALTWSTFLGGSGYEHGRAVAVDGSGNIYVSGESNVSWGSPLRAFAGSDDAFAVKLTSAGALTWNTFLGGAGYDYGNGIGLDGSGNVLVAGWSTAAWGSPVRAYADGYDGFAAKLTSAGALTWNTFQGGSGDEDGSGVAVDGSGNVYTAGYSTATWGSPVHPYSYHRDAYTAKLTAAGALTWNTFLGGSAHYACALVGMPLYDFNVDCETDVAVYRPSTGAWYIQGQPKVNFGSPGDKPVPGDYNGDGLTDIAVYRPSTGAWYVRGQATVYYGSASDIPVPGDYNGDGMTDIAVYRPATGAWYVRGQATVYYGSATDIPIPGDYNGCGTTMIAVYRPSTGMWYIRGLAAIAYGVSTDIPVPGDYNGDQTADVAVYRPSTGAWYVRNQFSVFYGAAGDIPVPGDYDGNGTTGIAVFRPSTGAWYVQGQTTVYYGAVGDIPIPELSTGKANTAP